MKYSGFLLVIILFALSCKKEPAVNGSYPYSNNILYHDFQPDTQIHSIQYFIPNYDPESCGDYPVPDNANVTLKIDIDGDGIDDLAFNAGQYPTSGGSIHCENVIYYVVMSGISGDSISFIHPQGFDVPLNYDTVSNNVIDNSASWTNSVDLAGSSEGGVPPPFFTSFNDTYIGIKINNKLGWIHIAPASLNGVIIKEYAINLTAFHLIKVGQKH